MTFRPSNNCQKSKKMYKFTSGGLVIARRSLPQCVFSKHDGNAERTVRNHLVANKRFYSEEVTKLSDTEKHKSKFSSTVLSQAKTENAAKDAPPAKSSATPPLQGAGPQYKRVFVYEKELDEDAKAEEEQKQEKARSWRTLKYSFIVLGASCSLAAAYALIFFGKPKIDEEGNIVIDEYSTQPTALQYISRALAEIHYYNRLIKEPSRDKLLPDVLQPPYYQPPYTLILEFTDVLVHPEWTYNTGWRFKKRPGLDQFLEALYTHFEMVVYTAEMGMTVFPIMDVLDKNNLISYKLVRDATNFVDGHHVKDLDKLNRDLSKVVVVDWNPDSTMMHTDNLFKIPRWDGSDSDTTLFDLANFLTAISEWEVEDVRGVLRHYSEFENPLSMFKERQKELLASQ